MKIQTKKFKDIEEGRYFLFNGEVFLKTQPIRDMLNNDMDNDWNCINLSINEVDYCPLGANIVLINEPKIVLSGGDR